MHSKDRYWPLIVCVDFLLLVMVPVIFGAGSALGILSLREMIAQVEWASLDIWSQLYGLFVIVCGFGFFTRFAFRARRRELFRKRALAGDERAMVVASTANNQLGAKALTEKPFALRWNKGYIVSATFNGLLWHRPKKRDMLVAWSDARLLERWERKWAHQDKADVFEYGYCLYADSREFIEWTDAPERQLSGESDISWEQKDALQRQLLAIITARTNLPVRFIESGSGTQKRGKRRRFGWVALLNLALFLLFAGVPLTTGVLALTAPFTRNLALNLVVATLYGGVGLLLLVLIAHAVIAVGRPDEPTLPPPTAELPLVPLATVKSSQVALRATIPLKQRVVSLILFIVCLLGAVYLEILSYQDFPISDTAHPRLSDAHQIIQALFFTCTFIVMILLGVGAFSRAEVLHADDTVLHWGKRRKHQSILWADVATLAAQVSAKGQLLESFKITEAPPQSRTIGWPTNARWVQPPEGASTDDAGAQFAAIVAQRAGVQPTTEWA